MITRKEIIENVLMAIRKTKEPSSRLMVEKFLQKQVFQISEMHSFHKLRRVMDVDMSEAGEAPDQGVWLPADLAGIDVVRDSDGKDLVRRDEAHIDPDEDTYRYYTYVPSMSPLFYGEDLTINKSADTFTSDALADEVAGGTSVVGEWCRFGGEYGFHKITAEDGSTFTFEPTYHGETLNSETFEVRPRGTQKLVIVKPNEDQVPSGTFKVFYFTYHPALNLDNDPIMFPHAGLVESIVIREAINNLGRRQLSSDKYIRDINEAWQITRRLNPNFPRQTGPRGRNNAPMHTPRTLYKRRSP